MKTERGEIKFKLSSDYGKLWERIKCGERVPAWLKYNERLWDIVEVRMMGNHYLIGSRGIGYEDYTCNKNAFIKNCELYELLFISGN